MVEEKEKEKDYKLEALQEWSKCLDGVDARKVPNLDSMLNVLEYSVIQFNNLFRDHIAEIESILNPRELEMFRDMFYNDMFKAAVIRSFCFRDEHHIFKSTPNGDIK